MDMMEFSLSVIGAILIMATGIATYFSVSPIIGVVSFVMGFSILLSINLAGKHNFPWRLYVLVFAIISLILGQGLLIGPVVAALAALVQVKNMLLPSTHEAQMLAYKKLLKED